MARVYDKDGKVAAEVDDQLLKDFFDEYFIEEKTLFQILDDYKPEVRDKISEYIVFRLAEVDPGYMPDRGY